MLKGDVEYEARITLKLKIDVTKEQDKQFEELQEQYRKACQFVSNLLL